MEQKEKQTKIDKFVEKASFFEEDSINEEELELDMKCCTCGELIDGEIHDARYYFRSGESYHENCYRQKQFFVGGVVTSQMSTSEIRQKGTEKIGRENVVSNKENLTEITRNLATVSVKSSSKTISINNSVLENIGSKKRNSFLEDVNMASTPTKNTFEEETSSNTGNPFNEESTEDDVNNPFFEAPPSSNPFESNSVPNTRSNNPFGTVSTSSEHLSDTNPFK